MRAQMDQSNLSSPPEGTDRARHRGIFSRSAATADAAFEAEMASYQQVLEDRLEQGLAAINQSANALMHEIASEVWRRRGATRTRSVLRSWSPSPATRPSGAWWPTPTSGSRTSRFARPGWRTR